MRFVLFNVYGVCIDFCGDGYLRGKKYVARLIIRILDLELTDNTIRTKYTGQSATHAFNFAAYLRKDTRTNLEINLASSELVGEKSWLHKMTKELVSRGSEVLCKGD